MAKPRPAAAQRAFIRPGEHRAPAGRGTSLARQVRAKTKGGETLIEFWARVMDDEGEDMRDRLTASKELALRGWGRPLQPIRLERGDEKPKLDLRLLTEDELNFLITLRARIEERKSLGEPVDAEVIPLPTLPASQPLCAAVDAPGGPDTPAE